MKKPPPRRSVEDYPWMVTKPYVPEHMFFKSWKGAKDRIVSELSVLIHRMSPFWDTDERGQADALLHIAQRLTPDQPATVRGILDGAVSNITYSASIVKREQL